MSIETYFLDQFQQDAAGLKVEAVNALLLRRPGRFLLDEETRFFGGKGWANCHHDLALVNEKGSFVSCIFAVLCSDLNMQVSFPEEYRPWRSIVFFPYFGWQEFRPFYESPEKVLTVPLALGLISPDDLHAEELAETWLRFLKRYFDTFIMYLTFQDFIAAMLKKNIFHEDHPELGNFLPRLRFRMEILLAEL